MRIYQVDVFTPRPLAGNAAGVVPDAEADGFVRFTCRMGDAVARPGEARVELTLEEGRPVSARVEGDVAVAFEAEFAV